MVWMISGDDQASGACDDSMAVINVHTRERRGSYTQRTGVTSSEFRWNSVIASIDELFDKKGPANQIIICIVHSMAYKRVPVTDAG
jgi:hypothetical protein